MKYNEMIKMEQVIGEYVGRFERKYNDIIYNEYLKGAEKIDLDNIAEKEVEEVVKPFLYKWGRMGRVLGRPKFRNWISILTRQIQLNRKKLESFRTKELASVNLPNLETDIKRLYEAFKEAAGAIAAVKVLHLICPNFFPLWDNGIANAVRSEYRINKKVENFSATDYYIFMQKIQDFILKLKYDKIISNLANKYQKGKLKIVDECLWWATHRPLSIFF
jgi:hypothetical protein